VHSFCLVILFLWTGCPFLQAQIVLPIEVLGGDGTSKSVTFQVSDASQVKGPWMQVNNLSYADKASVQINQGAYVNLNNNSVVIKGNDKIYGGIGGGFNTIKLTLPLSAGAIKNGSNSISFRFNKSDGVSIGYRVIKPRTHTSKAFQACLPKWEEKGLLIFYLPAYFPTAPASVAKAFWFK